MSDIHPTTYRKIVWSFALAETLVWASCYYIFPAMLLEWEKDLGWSKTALVSAFTTALIFSAVLAPFVGRLIDHGRSKYIMTASVLVAAFLLILLSQVTQFWQFFVIWVGLGITLSGMLYEACFTVLIRSLGNRSKQAITLVTLAAGFAGTISFPSAHYLAQAMGWRSAILIFAIVIIVLAAPLFWYATHLAEQHHRSGDHENLGGSTLSQSVFQMPGFWLLAIAFAAIAINHGALVSHLLPLLSERQIDPDIAVFAASMLGPMQVAGRLFIMVSEKRVSIFALGYTSFISLAIASLCLLFSNYHPALLMVFIVLQGSGHGLISILRPLITLKLLGQINFGTISGMIALPFMLGFALGPTLAALVWNVGGYDLVLKITIALALGGLLSFIAARRFS